jgi:GTP cyclohydrolase II
LVITTEVLSDRPLATAHGTVRTRLYRSSTGSVGMALWVGRVEGGAVLASRLHSSCFTSEALGGLDCDCAGQLDAALRVIAATGRGVVFYLLQEGRGAGLRAKVKDREIVQKSGGEMDTFGAYEQLGLPRDPRTYTIVPPICSDLGIEPSLRLMTNNPAKTAALTAAGIAVERVEHKLPSSELNAAYLQAKVRSGHVMRVSTMMHAVAPPELESLDPRVESVAGFRRVGSYSLPVRHAGGTAWFRATAYTYGETGHDRFVLTHRRSGAHHEVRHVYRDDIHERITQAGPRLERYRDAIDRAVACGAGSVLAVPADSELLACAGGPGEREDRELLDAHGAAVGAKTSEHVA